MKKTFETCTVSVIECLQVLRARVLCILAISGVSVCMYRDFIRVHDRLSSYWQRFCKRGHRITGRVCSWLNELWCAIKGNNGGAVKKNG